MTRIWIALSFAACAGSSSGSRAHRPTPPPHLEVLLDDAVARTNAIGPIGASFDVSPGRFVLLADDQRLYLLGWGGAVTVNSLPGKLDALAYTADGLLLVVRDQELDYLDTSGQLVTLFALPSPHMGLASGDGDTMYLFDREGGSGHFGLYRLRAGRRIGKLLESPQPIDDVASGGGRVYFTSGGAIFEATPGRPMRLVASLPGAPAARIRSLATDARGERVYYSDGAGIYELEGRTPTLVSHALGGTLHVRNGALLALDAEHHLVVRFRELP